MTDREMSVGFTISVSQTDMYGYVKPSALLELLQEAGAQHADALKLGRGDLLREIGGIWVMVRLYVRLLRPIRYGQRVDIATWGRVPGKATAYRDYDIFADSVPVGEAVSSSAVVSEKTRRLLRPGTIPGIENCAGSRPKSIELARLGRPGDLQPSFIHTVRYSDLDVNGHLNNTRYADLICNAAALHRHKDHYVSSLRINFLKECLPDEPISLESAPCGDHEFFVLGRTGGQDRFESVLRLSAAK